MITVLFACVHNAGRSQMAAAFFNALADPGKARAVSAGTEPADRVHPEVVVAMKEAGINLSGARPLELTPGLAQEAQLLVTMGCGEACPRVPGLAREDWPIEDPQGKSPGMVREIRDEIRRRVRSWVSDRGWLRRTVMMVEVLGPGCANCNRLFSLVEQAVKELGLPAKLGKVKDIGVIAGYGVMKTPAIVVDGIVKVSGRVPGLEEIKAILQGVK